MADKTTGGLPAVAESSIGDLPAIAGLYDDSLLPVEQQGEARHMTGAQWRGYAEAAAKQQAKAAAQSAQAAAGSASSAQTSAENAADSAEDASVSAQTAQQYSGKPPIIQGGTWWTWNATQQAYTDTGEAAQGNLMYATFYVDAATGDLYMVTDAEYTGPDFRLVDGDLEAILSYG